MVSCYAPGEDPVTVDAFSSLGWIGAHAVPGFEPCVDPDPIFVLLGSCFEAVAQHSSNIGHKIVDSLRSHRPTFCRRRRGRNGQPEGSGAVSVSDLNLGHSPPEIFVVDLIAPPSYEAALTMCKPRRTEEGLCVHDHRQGPQSHCQGHPPKYSTVKPTKEGVGKLCSFGEITYTTELALPPTYEQAVSNSASDYGLLCDERL